jgi:hypothetical protein
MIGKKNKVGPMPKEFTIYLPKKFRENACIDLGLGKEYTLEMLKEVDLESYNKLINDFKNNSPKNMIFVGVYQTNIIFFNCIKPIETLKKITKTQRGIDICIKKIIISDIDNIEATPFNEKLIHEPYDSFEQYTNYPATYTFDNPI